MPTLVLDGCRLEPLGSYLKALGVLRLVGTQLDPSARGWWRGDRFALDTEYDLDAVLQFLLDDYHPTSLLSPWNGGSGFGAKDKKSAQTLAAIEATDDPRFELYRRSITVVRRLATAPDWSEVDKEVQVARCRNELPDDAVPWIDAAIVLTGDAGRTFTPLFGTGGNDGRLEFSANFMGRALAVTGHTKLGKGVDRRRLLGAALLGDDPGPLLDGSSGQYDPGAGGGVNSAAVGDAGALLNPWDFVLTFEGGLLFASGAARRMGSEVGNTAAVPFSVDVSRAGPVGDREDVRAEIWAPFWRRPAALAEVTRLIGEGRAEWGGRSAANGVDFARAAAVLAVDRGISGFVRHGLMKRFGLSFIAVGLDRVRVGDRPEVRVTQGVDQWVRRLSTANAPAALEEALRRLDRALYATASSGGSSAQSLQNVLTELAGVEAAVARSNKREERSSQPVVRLDASDWYPVLEDHTTELRLAAAMASARDVGSRGEALPSALALLVRPVVADRQRLAWAPGPALVDGWGRRPVLDAVLDALVRRAIDLAADDADEDLSGQRGVRLGFRRGVGVSFDDVAALFDGRVDLDRLGRLLQGLVLLDWHDHRVDDVVADERPPSSLAPPVLAAVAPLLTGSTIRRDLGDGERVPVALRAASWWPAALAAGQVDRVAADALERLRIAGLDPAPRHIQGIQEDGPRLAAVAFCRLRTAAVHTLLDQTCPRLRVPQENE